MGWLSLAFTAPTALTDIADSAGAVLTNGPDNIATIREELAGVAMPAYSKNPLFSTATGIETQAFESLCANGYSVTVHPWTHGINQGSNLRGWLSSQNAVLAISEKLHDMHRFISDEPCEVLLLLASGVSYSQLANQLSVMGVVLPFPDLVMAQRRCAAQAEHERTKFQQGSIEQFPHWQAASSRQWPAMRDAGVLLGNQLALVDGYAAELDTVAELDALLEEKSQYIEEAQEAWDSFVSSFSGGDGQCLFLPAAHPSAQAGLVANHARTVSVYPLAVAVALAGPAGSLAVLAEVCNAA